MTPTETAALLRQLTEWRQGADIDPPAPRKIDEAINAAIEMIDRLEAAEKERDNANAAAVNIALEAERLQCENDALRTALRHEADCVEAAKAEIEALRAKIEAAEQQEPVGQFIQHPSNGLWEQDGYGDNPDARPLYALPGAQQGEGK